MRGRILRLSQRREECKDQRHMYTFFIQFKILKSLNVTIMYVTANFQSTAAIPCGSKLVVWDGMFPPQSRMQMIQVGTRNSPLQVCEAYWEAW